MGRENGPYLGVAAVGIGLVGFVLCAVAILAGSADSKAFKLGCIVMVIAGVLLTMAVSATSFKGES